MEEEDLQQLVAASRAVRDILGLILDDATRKAVSAANTKAFRLSGMRSVEPGEIETAWVAYVDAYGVAQDMIIHRIREIYKGSVSSP